MYETYFGFDRSPFNRAADPQDVYASAAFLDAHDALHSAVERGDQLIVLSGEAGTGKSTVLRQFRMALQARHFTVFTVDGNCGPDTLAQTSRAVQGFVSRTRDVSQAIRGLSGTADDDEPAERGVVVLVDDAHALPAQIANNLINVFCTDGSSTLPVSVIVATQPRFEQQLIDVQSRSTQGSAIELSVLRSMDDTDVGPYMQCKIEAAGYRGPALFSDEAIEHIATHSHQVPKRIDILCGMALLIASEASKRSVDLSTVVEALDDLEGHVEIEPPVSEQPRNVARIAQRLEAALQTTTQNLKPALDTAARVSSSVSVRAKDIARDLSGNRIWRIKHYYLRSVRAVHIALRGSKLHSEFKTGNDHAQPDWLVLKIGFVGLASTAVVGGMLLMLVNQENSSTWNLVEGHDTENLVAEGTTALTTSPSRISDAEQSIHVLPAASKLGETGALMSDKVALQMTLKRSKQELAATRHRVDQQDNLIANLRQQVASANTRLKALLGTKPATLTIPTNMAITYTTRAGERIEISPQDLATKDVRKLTIIGRFDRESIETLTGLSSTVTTQSAAQVDSEEPVVSNDKLKNAVAKPEPKADINKAVVSVIAPKKGAATKHATVVQADEATSAAPTSPPQPTQTVQLDAEELHESTANDAAAAISTLLAAADPASPKTTRKMTTKEAEVIVANATPPVVAPPSSVLTPTQRDNDTSASSRSAELDALREDAAREAARRKITSAHSSTQIDNSTTDQQREPQLPPVEDRSVRSASNEAPTITSFQDTQSGNVQVNSRIEHGSPGIETLPIAATQAPQSSTPKAEFIVYEVVSGDTLSATAKRFGVTVAQLRQWNNLSGDLLKIAQQLRIAPSSNSQTLAYRVSNATNRDVVVTASAVQSPRAELSESLLQAVKQNDVKAVTALLKQGAPVEAKNAEGKTPLILASINGQFQMVELLIKHGANVEARGKTRRTALSFAAWNGHRIVVTSLLRRGANVNSKNAEGWTPLMYASINGHTRCVRSLLVHGADVNARNRDRRTALSGAVWNGHTPVAQALLDAGANVNDKTGDGWTPLLGAAWNGQTKLVQLLLEYDADPNLGDATGLTPARAAQQRGHSEIASALSKTMAKSS